MLRSSTDIALLNVLFDGKSHFKEPKLGLYRLDHLGDSRMSTNRSIVVCLQHLFAYRRRNIDSSFEFEQSIPILELRVFLR
jgi:hypothetical protein